MRYVSLLKQADKWTPYVLYAFLRSQPGVRSFYNNVNYNTVPPFIPGAALINGSQRTGADYLLAWDQYSWSVGTAYSFSATSKLEAEFMRSHIGQMSASSMRQPAATFAIEHHVFSLSYNFAF